MRPMNHLIRANQFFGSGEMGVRGGLDHTPDELGQLAQSFDNMVSLLEMQENERKHADGMSALHRF
jgi:nitrogen fixation/metabolism regulation signal transduction histidine kinase